MKNNKLNKKQTLEIKDHISRGKSIANSPNRFEGNNTYMPVIKTLLPISSTLLLACLISPFFAKKAHCTTSSQQVGNTYFNSDDSHTTKVGNTYFHSDGTHTTQRGNFYFHSEGGHTTKVGNTYFQNSDIFNSKPYSK